MRHDRDLGRELHLEHEATNDAAERVEVYAIEIRDNVLEHAREWVGEGLGIENPTPAQLADVIRREADSQDIQVAAGESHPDYPAALRCIADEVENG